MTIKFKFKDSYIEWLTKQFGKSEKVKGEQVYKETYVEIKDDYVKCWFFRKTCNPEIMWHLSDMEYLEVMADD